MSESDPLEIVVVKGLGSGAGSLMIAFLQGETFPVFSFIPAVLLLGFVSYGLSIFFYVYAQRSLGATKTSAYYAVSPFIGVVFSLLIFREIPGAAFFIALAVMAAGAYFATADGMPEKSRDSQ